MRSVRKPIALLLTACLLAGVAGCGSGSSNSAAPSQAQTSEASGGGSEGPLNLKDMKIKLQTTYYQPAKPSTDDVLTPIWHEKTKVSAEVVDIPQDVSVEQWVQMQAAAGTLPEVIINHAIISHPAAMKYLVSSGKVWEITKDMAEKYMPNLVKRLSQFGSSIDLLMEDMKYEDGKVYYLPVEWDAMAFPKLQTDPRANEWAGPHYYTLSFRDDILTKIFPDAKTEDQLKDLYVKNGGKLSFEEATGDVPIKNRDDLYNYLKKVKALGLKVGEKNVIPAQLCPADPGSIMWALQTAYGAFWQQEFGYKDDQLNYLKSLPAFKDYVQWYNKLFNEGLMDPEAWIMKSDMIDAKAVNGEYAVINGKVDDARKLSQQENRGYGYRTLPIFPIELDNEFQNLTYNSVSLYQQGSIIFTKTIKEEDLPQILNWYDFNVSEEAMELRAWGPPEFYTGDGADRRFKPEYKDLEQDKAFGHADGEKNGAYYGLFNEIANNPEVLKINGFGYLDTPYNVYAATKTPSKEDPIDNAVNSAIRKHYRDQMKYYRRVGWAISDIEGDPDYAKAHDKIESKEAYSYLVNSLVCKPEEFDAKFKLYNDLCYGSDFQATLKKLQAKWKDIYDQHVKPEIDKIQ